MAHQKISEQLLSLSAVADRLGVNSRTVYKLVRRGDLSAFRIGRLYKVSTTELYAYLEKQRVRTA